VVDTLACPSHSWSLAGNVGFMRKGVGGSGGAKRMNTETIHLGADTDEQPIVTHDVAVDRSGIERPIQPLGRAVVLHRPE